MIYVIRVEYKEITLLKIGYCDDSRKDNRLSTYRTENPLMQPIFFIEGGTTKHEKRLHKWFEKFRYTGKEWFREEKEILDFFKTATLETLETLPRCVKDSRYNPLIRYHKEELEWMINRMLWESEEKDIIKDTDSVKKYIEMVVEENITTLEDTFSFLVSQFSFSSLSTRPIKKFLLEEFKKENPKIEKYYEELSKISNFIEKIKYICNFLKDLEEEEKSYYISYTPEPFKSYIMVLGIDFIISVKGRKNKLDEVISERIKSPNLSEKLDNIVYSKFFKDNKYTKSDIKSTLKEIYSSLGIHKTPKASDLENWFGVRSVSIYNSITKKREAGFELVKRK